MEGGEENREKINVSLRMNGFSGDLINGFMNKTRFLSENEMKLEEEEEIELSLGLSMNGRFGVDPTRKKLRRATSISTLAFTVGPPDNEGGNQARGAGHEPHAPLSRACSLPMETEEWRHQKVLMSAMSMEARKKRMEKLKNGRLVKDNGCVEDGYNCNEIVSLNENVQVIGSGSVNVVENGYTKLISQRSIGSQGSGSSGISDVQSQQADGAKHIVESKSPSSIGYIRDQGMLKPAIDAAVPKGPNSSLQNALLDMPFVSTKENGSNGNKVDGFLYGYKKGEEVRIVCVCHGMFLSPAEFVKHGGGGDVEHPLKHIVINPSPLF